jgi:hypothetical protein
MNQNKNVFYALSDELIFQIRELLQLSLLTDTNIVDHFHSYIQYFKLCVNYFSFLH